MGNPAEGSRCQGGSEGCLVALLYFNIITRISIEVMGCRSAAQFPQGWVGDGGPFLAWKALNGGIVMGLRKSCGSLSVLDGDSHLSPPLFRALFGAVSYARDRHTDRDHSKQFPKLRIRNSPFSGFLVIKRPKIKWPALIFPGRRKE